ECAPPVPADPLPDRRATDAEFGRGLIDTHKPLTHALPPSEVVSFVAVSVSAIDRDVNRTTKLYCKCLLNVLYCPRGIGTPSPGLDARRVGTAGTQVGGLVVWTPRLLVASPPPHGGKRRCCGRSPRSWWRSRTPPP